MDAVYALSRAASAKLCVHQDTVRRCLEHGVRYEPTVFTAQGGCQPHAESMISQIVVAIGKAKGADRSHGRHRSWHSALVTVYLSVG